MSYQDLLKLAASYVDAADYERIPDVLEPLVYELKREQLTNRRQGKKYSAAIALVEQFSKLHPNAPWSTDQTSEAHSILRDIARAVAAARGT